MEVESHERGQNFDDGRLVAGAGGVDSELLEGVDPAEPDRDRVFVAELLNGPGVALGQMPALGDPEGLGCRISTWGESCGS